MEPFFHRYDNQLKQFASSPDELRQKILAHFDMFLATGRITFSSDEQFPTAQSWLQHMSQDGTFADHLALSLAAQVLNCEIILIPIFPQQV